MTKFSRGWGFISEMLKDPEKFDSQGNGYALLQEYFHGMPVETLRPLLSHHDVNARRSVAFIVSELGKEAEPLIDDIIPLIQDSDPHIQWYAIESVLVCSSYTHFDQFIHVVRELENSDSPICELAMRLVSNANSSQIEAGIRSVAQLRTHQLSHQQGLKALLSGASLGNAGIIELIDDPDVLLKKYGAISAKRFINESPELIQHATESTNENVARFAAEALDRYRIKEARKSK